MKTVLKSFGYGIMAIIIVCFSILPVIFYVMGIIIVSASTIFAISLLWLVFWTVSVVTYVEDK